MRYFRAQLGLYVKLAQGGNTTVEATLRLLTPLDMLLTIVEDERLMPQDRQLACELLSHLYIDSAELEPVSSSLIHRLAFWSNPLYDWLISELRAKDPTRLPPSMRRADEHGARGGAHRPGQRLDAHTRHDERAWQAEFDAKVCSRKTQLATRRIPSGMYRRKNLPEEVAELQRLSREEKSVVDALRQLQREWNAARRPRGRARRGRQGTDSRRNSDRASRSSIGGYEDGKPEVAR